MRILVHSSERRYLDSNSSVWESLKKKGHTVIFWLHMHRLEANEGVVDAYRKRGFLVLQGVPMEDYDGQDAIYYISKFNPDIIIPVEPSIYSWVKIHKVFRSTFPEIPIVSIQNSFGGNTEEFYKDIKREGGWYLDWQLTWGSQQVARNIAGGLSKEKMVITGNPNWDKYFGVEIEDHGYVLFIAGTAIDCYKGLNLEKIWEDYPNLHFYFKEHPNHKNFFDRYSRIGGRDRVKICYTAPIQKLIRCAKVVVSSTSTCGVDSMILGKPTIILDVGENTNKFSNCGRVIRPTYEAFVKELNLCLEGKEDRSKVSDFLSQVSFTNDGQAAQRVVEAILRVIGG